MNRPPRVVQLGPATLSRSPTGRLRPTTSRWRLFWRGLVRRWVCERSKHRAYDTGEVYHRRGFRPVAIWCCIRCGARGTAK